MQIAPTTPILPTSSADQQSALAQAAQIKAAKLQASQEAAAAKPFEPAPQIRPNVQDYLDIDRCLMLLRQV